MTNLNSELLKDKKVGEGIIFIKTSDGLMKMNFHVGEDGYLYAGGKKIRFDTQKLQRR